VRCTQKDARVMAHCPPSRSIKLQYCNSSLKTSAKGWHGQAKGLQRQREFSCFIEQGLHLERSSVSAAARDSKLMGVAKGLSSEAVGTSAAGVRGKRKVTDGHQRAAGGGGKKHRLSATKSAQEECHH
jgi:hypothetical protein